MPAEKKEIRYYAYESEVYRGDEEKPLGVVATFSTLEECKEWLVNNGYKPKGGLHGGDSFENKLGGRLTVYETQSPLTTAARYVGAILTLGSSDGPLEPFNTISPKDLSFPE
jgi:hypothetical protein